MPLRHRHLAWVAMSEQYLSRDVVSDKILAAKVANGIRWSDVADRVGKSKEWVTAACLGQMTMTAEQADVVGGIFALTPAETVWLTVVPSRGDLVTGAPPSDPLIYRLHELVSVYGMTIKELIHEEFGDGIMSAIDFNMQIEREPDPKGDRVRITMSGKFLSYASY